MLRPFVLDAIVEHSFHRNAARERERERMQ